MLSLGRLCNELGRSYSWPTGETPRLSKGKKVIESNIENFIPLVAVTKQKTVPSLEFLAAKGNLEREKTSGGHHAGSVGVLRKGQKNTVDLPLWQLGVTLRMKLSKNRLMMRYFPRLPLMLWEIQWQKDTKSKKGIIGSQPRGNHHVFTHYPKDPNCEVFKKTKKQDDPGVGKNQRSAWTGLRFFYKIRRLDHGRSQISERGEWVEMRRRERPNRARRFREWDPEFSDEDKGNIGNNVVFTKIYFFVTEAGNNLHRKFQSISWSLSIFTMGSWHKHTSSLRNERSGRKSRLQSERGNSHRTRPKRTTRRMVWLCDGTAIVTCATCTTRWPMARQRSRKDMSNNLTDHQSPLEHLVEYIPITAKDKSRVHQ